MALEILTNEHIVDILPIVAAVNSRVDKAELEARLNEMFSYDNYICFGFFDNAELIAVTSGWALTKLYSGKQLELDNVAVIEEKRSQGVGQKLTAMVEQWAKERGYISVELNSYVTNARSHKFYFNQGYTVIGYHFQKDMN
ncbi:GNAT family N-acetyltransferase [Pseudomonadota bacterium]